MTLSFLYTVRAKITVQQRKVGLALCNFKTCYKAMVIDTSGAGVSTDTQINRTKRKNELSHLWPTDSQWGSG